MVATISMVESDVFTALRAWAKDLLPANVEVIQGLDNRVPTPNTDFVVMTRVNKLLFEWAAQTWTDEFVDTGCLSGLEILTHTQAIDFAIQLDCYGPNSGEYITILATLFSTSQACDSMEPSGVSPLYTDEPKKMPFIDGEKQYQPRWVMTAHLQYNPAISTAMQFTSTAEVETFNVDRTFPPV